MTVIHTDTTQNISKITGEPLKKRGRKPKKDILQNNILLSNDTGEKEEEKENNVQNENNPISILMQDTNEIIEASHEENTVFLSSIHNEIEEQKSVIKKRGRKPKGGKIIQQIVSISNGKEIKPNVILHLKCSLKELYKNGASLTNSSEFISYNEYSYDSICSLENNKTAYNNQNYNKDEYEEENVQNNGENEPNDNYDEYTSACSDTKELFKKLKNLQHNLHVNNINDKKSACFWCTYDFDNPPIYIPKHFIKETYEVYGCFCTPECATAYLMEENIDSSDKFERYHMLNHIYTKIYNYNKNIKPAPNPYYMLDKYYGNLSIQEYRTLLRGERLFLVVDKPLTRILPELHEDNDDFIINNKIIPSNAYQIKKKMQKKTSKHNILNEHFGVPNQ
jgi:hypothetical protein